MIDRNSEKYKNRRERNNVSVRKSRAKSKSKMRLVEERVQVLESENAQLKTKLRSICKFLKEFDSSFFSWKQIAKEMVDDVDLDKL